MKPFMCLVGLGKLRHLSFFLSERYVLLITCPRILLQELPKEHFFGDSSTPYSLNRFRSFAVIEVLLGCVAVDQNII
jgi:hypothetical protein